MTTMHRRRFGACLLAALLWAGSSMPAMAQSRGVAYVGQTYNSSGAYLIDWQSATRAQVATNAGARGASVVRTGAQRVLTLDSPFSAQTYSDEIDPCIGMQAQQRVDTLQYVVTTLSGSDNRGTSKVVELGTVTTLDGCSAGAVTPFGAATDPGFPTRHLALSLRPAVSDLVPGVALAGPSAVAREVDNPFIAADVLTLQAGGLGIFGTAGLTVPAAFDADQWLALALPSGERAYARLFVDRRTGAELWLDIDRSGGVPAAAYARLMVKPQAGASFGTQRQASRMWNSGLAATPTSEFLIYLYQTGSGERVSRDLVTGTESRTPISWGFSGGNIVQNRSLGGGTGVRTWTPLLNGGGRATFVMESERRFLPDGSEVQFIAPRINFYTDTGAATPPTGSR